MKALLDKVEKENKTDLNQYHLVRCFFIVFFSIMLTYCVNDRGQSFVRELRCEEVAEIKHTCSRLTAVTEVMVILRPIASQICFIGDQWDKNVMCVAHALVELGVRFFQSYSWSNIRMDKQHRMFNTGASAAIVLPES